MPDSPTAVPTRQDRARATRLRVVRAAHDCFVDRGYAGTRMTDIAARAEVAVQTVYFIFHTKAELLQACYERAVLSEDDPTPPMEQPWFTAFRRARSGRGALRAFADGNTAIVQRVGVLDDVARSARHEADAVAVRTHSEQLRRAGYAELVRDLDERFGLRDGLDRDSAVDLLLTLGGFAPYCSLVIDYAWTHDQFVDWLATTLTDQLIGPGRARAPRPVITASPR